MSPAERLNHRTLELLSFLELHVAINQELKRLWCWVGLGLLVPMLASVALMIWYPSYIYSVLVLFWSFLAVTCLMDWVGDSRERSHRHATMTSKATLLINKGRWATGETLEILLEYAEATPEEKAPTLRLLRALPRWLVARIHARTRRQVGV